MVSFQSATANINNLNYFQKVAHIQVLTLVLCEELKLCKEGLSTATVRREWSATFSKVPQNIYSWKLSGNKVHFTTLNLRSLTPSSPIRYYKTFKPFRISLVITQHQSLIQQLGRITMAHQNMWLKEWKTGLSAFAYKIGVLSSL